MKLFLHASNLGIAGMKSVFENGECSESLPILERSRYDTYLINQLRYVCNEAANPYSTMI
jgi:hypothetical protein